MSKVIGGMPSEDHQYYLVGSKGNILSTHEAPSVDIVKLSIGLSLAAFTTLTYNYSIHTKHLPTHITVWYISLFSAKTDDSTPGDQGASLFIIAKRSHMTTSFSISTQRRRLEGW